MTSPIARSAKLGQGLGFDNAADLDAAVRRLANLSQIPSLSETDDIVGWTWETIEAAAAAFVAALYGPLPDNVLDAEDPDGLPMRIQLTHELREDVLDGLVKGFIQFANRHGREQETD